MDISFSEKQKKLIRFAVWFLRKKLGEEASTQKIYDSLNNTGNPLFQRLNKLIVTASSHLIKTFQSRTVLQLGQLGLWMLYRDTAYKDCFIWMLNEILENADEYREALKPYLKEPDDWYPNVWARSQQRTREKKQKGEIPSFGMSECEEIFTPQYQDEKLKKLR